MATFYLPNENGWQANGGGTYSTYLRVKLTTSYNSSTNRTAVTAELQVKNAVFTLTWNSINDNYRSFAANGHAWTLDSGYRVETHGDETWRTLTKTGAPAFDYTLSHDSDGHAAISVSVDLYLYAIWYVGNVRHEAHSIFGGLSATQDISQPRGSVIASCPSSAATQDTLALTVTRYSNSFYHKATFRIGGTTLATSAAFATSLNVTLPRSWFDGCPNDTSKTVTVSVQTYTDSSCTTAVGSPATASFTLTADPGMKPTIGSGFASVAAYNAGTAAAGISGYVQGYSRARLTLTKSGLTMANNATVASYKLSCQGASTTKNSPGATETMDTATLTGTGAVPITVTVTDSRGRTASTTLSVTPMAYANPTLTGISVFRCDSGGTADEDGTSYSAKATASRSSLNGQNSVTLTARIKASGGSYGSAAALTSGTARVLGGALSPDTSYTVLLTATDSLGNSATATVTLPQRKWAMKFRPDGEGVGFGKAPEHSKALEIPADWDMYFGTEAFKEHAQKKTHELGVAIPSNSDLDSFTTPGSYYCANYNTATTLSNAPIVNNFRLEVTTGGNASYPVQFCWTSATFQLYMRRFLGSQWSPWTRFCNTVLDYASYSVTNGQINSSSLRVTRQMNWVNIEGYITLKAQSYVANTTVLFTLPDGARPSGDRIGWFHRPDAHIHVVIKSNGEVVAGDAYTATGTPYFFGNLTFSL